MISTMQLEFTQAMSDFKVMFPEMDDDVIEAVLRSNQGAVDATIDQLLAMSTDNQNEKLRNEIENVECGSKPRCSNKFDYNKQKGRPPDLIDISDGNQPLHIRRNWKPKLLGELPSDFLRLPGLMIDCGQTEVCLEDSRIAMLLQNEEFLTQLKWNQDFMSTLNNEDNDKNKRQDDEDFRERIKNMGKLSRRKFAQISRMFTWQSNKKQNTNRNDCPATDSLLLQEEHSDDDNKEQSQGTSSNPRV